MSRYGGVILWCSLLALAAAGCQRDPTWNLAPVEGTVTKGGRPLANLEVVFLADLDVGTLGPRATAKTDAAGHYRLRTDSGDNGAVIGKHRVVVRDIITKQMLDLLARPQGKAAVSPPLSEPIERLRKEWKDTAGPPRVPPRYGHFNKTPLRVEVRPEAQVIDLEVK